MRLKKLIVQGFKSFADRTEFCFDAPITGIVGPNGCGKSNVVDGFKWVLGEQSAKSLRGDAMMDVIFNGSSTRKPSGMAEVTLVFENPQRTDGTRQLALDVEEVHVGRRLFRDGTSEYQLNNQSSRLKDIRELFLDTGVGADAYSVIEQGKVAAMLEANPEERRTIFEEAAGISKYKVKKKESQRKLEKVEQNLLRLNDIVEEVEKRLRSVKAQAGRARTYQEHNQRLGELRLSYSLQEYHTLRTAADEVSVQLDDAQFRCDDLASELARSQTQLGEVRAQHEVTSTAKQQAEYELVQATAKLESAKQRQHYASQQLQQIADQHAIYQHDHDGALNRSGAVAEELETAQANLRTLTGEAESNRAIIDQKQVAFRDAQLQVNQITQQLDQLKSSVLDLMKQLSNVDSRTASIDIERQNVSAQQHKIGARRDTLIADAKLFNEQRAVASEKLAAVAATISDQQARAAEQQAAAAALDEQIARVGAELGGAREHRSGMQSRQKLLADLEARREGVSEGVKAVLRQREGKFSFVRGIVADLMRVDVEHATVIEAALNGQDQTLVINEQAVAAASAEALAELSGRVNFISADRVSAALRSNEYDWNVHPQRIRLASDLVKFASADRSLVFHLLGSTAVVDTLDDARALHLAAPCGFRFVTASAEVIESDGTLRAGPLTAAMGLLSRRSELDAIESQLHEVDGRIAVLTDNLAHGNAQARGLEEQVNALRAELYQSNTVKVELSSQVTQIGDKLAAVDRELPLLDREIATLNEKHDKLDVEQMHLSERRTRLADDHAQHSAQIEQLQGTLVITQENLKVWAEELTAARVALGEAQQKQMSARSTVDRQTAALSELKQQIERLANSLSQLADRQEQVEHEKASAEHTESSLIGAVAELTQRGERLRAKVVEATARVVELSTAADLIQTRHAEIEEALHAAQLASGENKVRLESLVQRTLDELGLDLPTRHGEGYEPAEMDWAAVGEEIKQLREKIQRLGNVNLDSINELEELEQRTVFYATQVNDLTTSKQQLVELIDTINRESSVRFEQTFNAVREHFQGMFRKLFGGGKADIYLETELEDRDNNQQPVLGPDGQTVLPVMRKTIDALDAGIEIIAKPPGKQPCSISQLSGGEKTMTCVALLMSIFKSKPSPFCILDEVDAALDEANNQRFNLIVQEFLEMSQFIIITHSKRTMQVADVLYGITQQEQGVSKRVAVKFDQVDHEGRIAKEAVAAA